MANVGITLGVSIAFRDHYPSARATKPPIRQARTMLGLQAATQGGRNPDSPMARLAFSKIKEPKPMATVSTIRRTNAPVR